MAIVKVAITLQDPSDVDALLVKRGNSIKGKSPDRGYDIDVQNGVVKLVSWDTALGPAPTQNEANAIVPGDRVAGEAALQLISMKKSSLVRDRLTDFAMMRIVNDRASWDKLDDTQKVAAVIADADLWVSVRLLLESANAG